MSSSASSSSSSSCPACLCSQQSSATFTFGCHVCEHVCCDMCASKQKSPAHPLCGTSCLHEEACKILGTMGAGNVYLPCTPPAPLQRDESQPADTNHVSGILPKVYNRWMAYPVPIRWSIYGEKKTKVGNFVITHPHSSNIMPELYPDVIVLLPLPAKQCTDTRAYRRLSLLTDHLRPRLTPGGRVEGIISSYYRHVGCSEVGGRDSSIYAVQPIHVKDLAGFDEIDASVQRISDGMPVKELMIAYGWLDTRDTVCYIRLKEDNGVKR